MTRHSWRFVVVVAVVTVGLAAAWSLVARRELHGAIVRALGTDLERSRATFALTRQRMQDSLRAECRLLVEDPRVKSTLATEGMDEGTVSDILRDLGRLRGRGFLLVLSPAGRVFAEAGADELRGLDLSASNVVKSAQTSPDAVVGSWVIGNRLIDLGIMTVRLDATIVAYLVVGQPIDRPFLQPFADAEAEAAAILLGDDVSIASSDDPTLAAALAMLARGGSNAPTRVIETGGAVYVATISELEQSLPSRPKLVLLRAVEPSVRGFRVLEWILIIPPILVLVAVLLAASRSSRRAP